MQQDAFSMVFSLFNVQVIEFYEFLCKWHKLNRIGNTMIHATTICMVKRVENSNNNNKTEKEEKRY